MKVQNFKILLDQLVSVSFKDEVLGSIPKWDAHLNQYIVKENSMPHRAFSIFLFNSQNKLLFQRRSSQKKTFPLCWTNTCCSHPNMVQVINEKNERQKKVQNIRDSLQRALHRQLKMNLTGQNFYLVDKILYKADTVQNKQQFGQYEVDYVYICKVNSKQIGFEHVKQQVCETQWVERNKVQQFINNKMVKQNCRFSPWFLKMFKNGLVCKWWDLAINNQLRNVNTQQNLKVTQL